MMNHFKAVLIGQLVGLARATDGNEHLISDSSTALIRECLTAKVEDESVFRKMFSRVEDVKRAMVPDCFLCANPCGKTAPLDLDQLDALSSEERAAKARILEALLCAAMQAPASALYRGLIALGIEGLSPEFLNTIAQEINN